MILYPETVKNVFLPETSQWGVIFERGDSDLSVEEM